MDVVDLTLSDSEDETVHHRDRRRLPAWSSSPINHSSSMVFRPNAIVGGTLVPATATISRDARKIGGPHLPPQNVINSINYEGVNEVGEIMHVGGIASGRDAGSYLHETAIQGRRLPPSFMQEKPVSGASGLGGILVNKERILDLGYKSLSVSAPLLTDEFQSHLGPCLANGPIGKSKIEDVPSGPNFHGHTLHPSAEIPTSKPLVSADGHTFIYRSDNDQLLNLDDPNIFHGKEAVQRAPFSEYVMRENEEVLIYESFSSRRKLPASLSNGKHSGISSTSGYNETMPHHSVPEEKTKDADERIIFRAALDGLSQPAVEANLPDGLLSVPLLRHQKIALAWMVHQETRSFHCSGGILADDQGLGKTVSTIALILMQRNEHSKFISNSTEHVRKEALDLDAEGENADELAQFAHQNDSGSQSKTTVSTGFTSVDKGRPAAGTLVVCPASVLRQWAQELSDKIASDSKLLFLVYYGANRTKDPFELAKYDVILTTYAIVSMEVQKQPLVDEDDGDQRTQEKYGLSSDFSSSKKAKRTEHRSKKRKGKKGVDGSFVDQEISPLARVRWFRVVLDEAQTIKNYRTQVARACCSLRAKRRWCLSGTPMQNAIDDLYSYFRFLKYDPYTVYSSFCSTLKHPISRNASKGYKKLQAVLRTIMLRRTKDSLIDGKPIINLPPKTILLKKVDFSIEERAFYSKLEADSRMRFKEYATAGTVNQNYANILLLLLRLRQACDHPLLVKGYHSESINKLSTEAAHKLPTEIQMNLLNHLESSSAICEICSDPPEDAVISICGHVFCNQCISERLTGDENFCPSVDCKSQIGTDSIFSSYALRSNSDPSNGDSIVSAQMLAESADVPGSCSSSKIKATLDILLSLNQMQQSNNNSSLAECDEACTSATETDINRCSPDFNSHAQLGIESATKVSIPEKAIVFSQWTSMLDLLEVSLNGSCIQYRRLDGTMSLAARDRAVKDFNTLPEVTVMIMSLKAGNLGLNMVAANHIVLLDLWWNPTTEDQAIDRAHRIGQIRPVTVSRLTITNTIEDRILALQEEKRKMVASAFGEDQAGGFATRLTVDDLRYLFMV